VEAMPVQTSTTSSTTTVEHIAQNEDHWLLQLMTQPTAVTSNRHAEFLTAHTVKDALTTWFGEAPDTSNAQQLARRMNAAVAQIDALVEAFLNELLHHPALQKLEASWRGLKSLVERVPDGANIKIRVFQATWNELVKDQERALEFDQSALFRKVYGDEFDTPGGTPYGLLLADYAVCHRPLPGHPTDDMFALGGLSSVAAAAFAPLVCGVDPRFFEIDHFNDLDPGINLDQSLRGFAYTKWNAFRVTEDARFVGLVLPQVMMRAPYGDEPAEANRFQFRECIGRKPNDTLWGSGVYAFGAVAIRAFAQSAWLADVRGTRQAGGVGGEVDGFPEVRLPPPHQQVLKPIINVMLTDRQEKELAELGFLPLCHRPGTNTAAFYSVPSTQRPKQYDDEAATANARLSAQLPYILCVSRMAHYVKVIARDRIGQFSTADDCREHLERWLQRYVVTNDAASYEMKAKYPLRDARVEVQEVSGKPGSFRCAIHLRPHFQLDRLSASIRFSTQLNSARSESSL
jgi:type VI secretion system protein ImpD